MGKQRILVTGANGQLGKDLVDYFQDWDVYGMGKEELNITNADQVSQVFQTIKPDIVIHAAAYTKVDLAESEKDQAYLINGYGTRNIARAAQEINAKLVYISTDYVFSGQNDYPYDEFEMINPINIYGRSKWMGERFVETLHSRFYIVRTSWVYGQHGNNFVKTMLKLGREQGKVSVVNDQFGCPTYTRDLCKCIENLINTEQFGTYHVSNSGSCSWYEFAAAIFRIANMNVELSAITSNEFSRPAQRPAYSIFEHMSLRLGGFPPMRHWEEALEKYLSKDMILINN